ERFDVVPAALQRGVDRCVDSRCLCHAAKVRPSERTRQIPTPPPGDAVVLTRGTPSTEAVPPSRPPVSRSRRATKPECKPPCGIPSTTPLPTERTLWNVLTGWTKSIGSPAKRMVTSSVIPPTYACTSRPPRPSSRRRCRRHGFEHREAQSMLYRVRAHVGPAASAEAALRAALRSAPAPGAPRAAPP